MLVVKTRILPVLFYTFRSNSGFASVKNNALVFILEF